MLHGWKDYGIEIFHRFLILYVYKVPTASSKPCLSTVSTEGSLFFAQGNLGYKHNMLLLVPLSFPEVSMSITNVVEIYTSSFEDLGAFTSLDVCSLSLSLALNTMAIVLIAMNFCLFLFPCISKVVYSFHCYYVH